MMAPPFCALFDRIPPRPPRVGAHALVAPDDAGRRDGTGKNRPDPGGVGRRVDPRRRRADGDAVAVSPCLRWRLTAAGGQKGEYEQERHDHSAVSRTDRPRAGLGPRPRIPSTHRRALESHAATSPVDARRAVTPITRWGQRWSSASATAQASSGIMSSWCPVIWNPSPPASTGRRTTFSLGR